MPFNIKVFYKIFRVFVISLLLFNINTAKAQNAIPQPGEAIPDELWDLPLQVINHPLQKETITLGEYRDKKLIILDFWATWCGACISMFSKTKALQAHNDQDIVILPVTYESLQKVQSFNDRRMARNNEEDPLYTVYGHKVLQKWFPHKFLPHYVWITGSGTFLGCSNGDQLIQGNINSAIQGISSFQQKKDVRINYEPSVPIFRPVNGLDDDDLISYSAFGKYKRGLSGGRMTGKLAGGFNRITCLNVDIISMVTTAYSRADRFFVRNLIRFLGRDSSFIKAPEDYEEHKAWRLEHTFCYEIIGKESVGELLKLMQQDLTRNFPQFKIEPQFITQPCWVMKGSSKHPKLKASGGDRVSVIDLNGCTLKNASLFDLFFQMKFLLLQNSKIPLEFELTDDYPVDLEFFADMTDMDAVNKALKPYGIQFVKEVRPVEMIVIQDRN